MNLIETHNLTKFYGKLKALDNVTLSIPEGRIIGLLGKNGAGKSTLMRCLLGFLKFKGNVNIMGKTLSELKESIHDHIAFIPDVSCLDDKLTVKQTIDYVAALNQSWNQEKATDLLAKSDLPIDKKVSSLSKGMKTKLYLLITLSLDVQVLLLDEPTLGLDIVFRKEFFNTILGEFYDENKTIIISTHQVEEVEQILQDIIFIDDGEIILYENIEELKKEYSIFTVTSDKLELLQEHKPRLITKTLGHHSAILPSNIKIADAQISKPTLSDLFLEKVGGSNEKI
ncbi:MAG: ABC transporter ATP-binding protein [Candidatus Cloacimonetes bacterium]|nr:ABC transporter ATP-binding protein [Candidatus Cloacimonadota bacterium]MCF7814903.1 ABC transporter ATP-binding protein [Candidatus Cloacimonadota bacterium]MCF7869302.1 ABC transporter ATP-binding protein [Candidatus Cloacimonadota bacterium]MCF7884618.1 ABC transporter ATP-binding protein [Candidatus Cloacimonadota bacterium]